MTQSPGGFSYYDVYHMPIPIRKYNIKKVSDYNQEVKEKVEQAAAGNKGETMTMKDMINKTGGVQSLVKPDYVAPKPNKKS